MKKLILLAALCSISICAYCNDQTQEDNMATAPSPSAPDLKSLTPPPPPPITPSFQVEKEPQIPEGKSTALDLPSQNATQNQNLSANNNEAKDSNMPTLATPQINSTTEKQAPSSTNLKVQTPKVPSISKDGNTNAINPDNSINDYNTIKVAIPVSKHYIEDKAITIATGPSGGIYYPAGEAICRVLNRNKKTVKLGCMSEPTDGSIYNLQALSEAKFSFALVQSDWQKRAYTGIDVFKKDVRAFENMRSLFSLHNELLTIIVKKNSSIISLNDLTKKTVNFGPEESGTRALMNVVMGAKGWNKETFLAITSLPLNEQAQALCNKDIDVMVAVTGHPSNIIQEASETCEIRILNIANDPQIESLVKNNKEYAMATIDGGLYSGVPQDVATFGTKATLVTTSDMSDDVVYRLVKAIFSNLNYFKKLNPTFNNLSPQKMVEEGETAPMHAGAAKYYREAGYMTNDQ